MSRIVETSIGRFRQVSDGTKTWFLWECACGSWCSLSEDQWAGRVSVDHDSQGCPAHYHQTHDFGKALLNAIQAAMLMGDAPYVDERPDPQAGGEGRAE